MKDNDMNIQDNNSIEYAKMYSRFFAESIDERYVAHNMISEKKEQLVDEESDEKDNRLPSDVQKEIDAAAAKDPENGSKIKKVAAFLGKTLNSASSSAIASLVDNFTLGNMKEAICDIYKKKLEKMSEDDIDAVGKELHEMPEFQKAKQQYVDSDKRQDDNTSTEIDVSTIQCRCIWYSKKNDQNVLKILSDLVADIQKQAKAQDDQIKELKSKVKSMKIEGVGDEEVDAFGPIIANMVKDKKSNEEIAKKVSQLKSGVKESYNRKFNRLRQKMILEHRTFITEDQKKTLLIESIWESEDFQDNLARYMIEEGIVDAIKKGAKGAAKIAKAGVSSAAKGAAGAWKATSKMIPQKFKDKIKDAGSKALDALKNGGLTPILKIAGIGLLAVSGAWGIALVISTMMLIEKHGKQLKYAFDYAWSSFANSKGVIAQFDFKTKGNDSKYSARFYVKDATWRVINASNQNKHPSKDFAKAILTSDFGKKFTNRIVELWDPVFSPDKGGKIDFSELLKQSKALNLSDKQLALLNDFKNAYPNIRANILKPQIDTRTQEF